MVRFDVDEIVFRSNIKVTNEGEMLAFATSTSYTDATDGATTTSRLRMLTSSGRTGPSRTPP